MSQLNGLTIEQMIRAVQLAYGITADGLAGPETWTTIYRDVVNPPTEKPVSSGDIALVDERSEKNIATLLPIVRPMARALVQAAAAQGIEIKVIDGSRSYAQQDALYAQGRTKPGKIVTKARGGHSWHNFAVAFDIGIFHDGKYISESPLYKVIGSLGKSIGLEWGGNWTSIVDEPHFQFNPNRLSLAEARNRQKQGLPIA